MIPYPSLYANPKKYYVSKAYKWNYQIISKTGILSGRNHGCAEMELVKETIKYRT